MPNLSSWRRFWGGFLVGVLAAAAQAFDAACVVHLGCSLGSVSLLLLLGFVTSMERQACPVPSS